MRFLSDLAEDEVRAKTVTWDLFESESSIKVRPQVSELHGVGMVPTKVVENGQTCNQRSCAEVSAWTSPRELQSSKRSRWLAFGGDCSRGKSDKPSSKRPWVAIFTLAVWQSHHRKFLVVMGV